LGRDRSRMSFNARRWSSTCCCLSGVLQLLPTDTWRCSPARLKEIVQYTMHPKPYIQEDCAEGSDRRRLVQVDQDQKSGFRNEVHNVPSRVNQSVSRQGHGIVGEVHRDQQDEQNQARYDRDLDVEKLPQDVMRERQCLDHETESITEMPRRPQNSASPSAQCPSGPVGEQSTVRKRSTH
jgi:hypothetical protein